MDRPDYCLTQTEALESESEDAFFSHLRERFLRLARYKIREANDAEEVVQEAMMAIIDQYRNPEFDGKFLNWAFTVLRNKIVDYQRKKIRSMQREIRIEDNSTETISGGIDPEEALAGTELREKLKQAMSHLNRKEATLLESLLSGDNRRQMAIKLGLSANTLYVKVNRLRCKLQRLIHQEV